METSIDTRNVSYKTTSLSYCSRSIRRKAFTLLPENGWVRIQVSTCQRLCHLVRSCTNFSWNNLQIIKWTSRNLLSRYSIQWYKRRRNVIDNSISHHLLLFTGRSRGPVKQENKKIVKLERQCIDIYSVNAAAHAGEFQLKLMDETERLLRIHNVTVRPNSSAYNHLTFFQTTTEAQRLSRGALIAIETTRELGKRFVLSFEYVPATNLSTSTDF